MTTVSIWRVEFVPVSGTTIRLLDYGDRMSGEPVFPIGQDAFRSTPIGSRWSRFRPSANMEGEAKWSRRTTYADPMATRAAVWRLRDQLPNAEGKITVAIENGETWELLDAAIISALAMPERRIPNAVMTEYSAMISKARPVSEITLFAGIRPDWINQKPSAIAAKPSAL